MFTRLSIPTPFAVGPVNAYLAGRTVVDPGPASDAAWETLVDGLAARDLTPEDVEQVIVTHPHPDHFGQAARLREAGAAIVAGETCADVIADFAGRLQLEQDFFVEHFERHGMDRATAETVTGLAESFLTFAPDVTTDVRLADGESVTVEGTELTSRAVVGHAPGERIFTYETDGEKRAIVGDHVLAEITPNPLLQPAETPDEDRPRVLPAYNRSLERIRDGGFDRLLAGHRQEIDDPSGRIDDILAAHEERTANVRALVNGQTTAIDVMHGLFPDLPATEYFPGMSEAVGHLDVLEARGEVTQREADDQIVYERDA